MDPARCSRNFHLHLLSSKKFTHPVWKIKAGFFWHCCLWSLPHIDCSFTSHVWGQHSRNYNSWTTWCSTPHHKKIQPLLKIPVWDPTSGCNRPFTVLILEDTVTPGLLVAYSHKFYIQTQSSQIYFVNSPAAYCCGLLARFVLSAVTQTSADSFLLCAVHSYCLPACCSFAPTVESAVNRQWLYKTVLLSSLRNQYQLAWCPKRPRPIDVTERSGWTYNHSYTK